MKVLMPRWLLGRRALAAGLLAVALTASAVKQQPSCAIDAPSAIVAAA